MKATKLCITILLVILLIISPIILIKTPIGSTTQIDKLNKPTVKINIEPHSVIYEGDVINCDITGNPDIMYWKINNFSEHYTFNEDNPIIFDPEPTPLKDDYVDLTVYIENNAGNATDTVEVMIKRIYFGDIHWHTTYGDGNYGLDLMYQNTIDDKYLDFAACSEHAYYPLYKGELFPLLKRLINRIQGKDPWQILKDKAIKFYEPGNFTTLLGFEWSAHNYFPGGLKFSPNGHEDVSHINFYYRDIYPDARKYSPLQRFNYDSIFKAMAKEWDKGHLNIGFPHHPLGKIYWFGTEGLKKHFPFYYTANWSFLSREVKNTDERDKILRGVETYSRWGTSIGKYSGMKITWPYLPDDLKNNICMCNKTDSWVENALWEWSKDSLKGRKFVLQAGSDTHSINRAGSASLDKQKPSGIMAAYAVHNTRSEIWDAMNECDIYGSQLLKIRANVRFDGEMALGRWINCTNPLTINISAMSTFQGFDSNERNMCPHNYSSEELDHPISDIWIIKKDTARGRPYCKIINHTKPNNHTAVITFNDYEVQPNDFYYVAIRQKGEELLPGQNEYTAFLGPVFIDKVKKDE